MDEISGKLHEWVDGLASLLALRFGTAAMATIELVALGVLLFALYRVRRLRREAVALGAEVQDMDQRLRILEQEQSAINQRLQMIERHHPDRREQAEGPPKSVVPVSPARAGRGR